MKRFIAVALFYIISQPLLGQSIPDQLKSIKSLYTSGETEKAFLKIDSLYKVYPEHHDVMMTKASLNAWEKNYSIAIEIIDIILSHNPSDLEASQLKSSIYYWTQRNEEGLLAVDHGLNHHPEDKRLRILKVQFLNALNKKEESQALFEKLETENPKDPEVVRLKNLFKSDKNYQSVSVRYTFDYFQNPYSDWNTGQIEYTHASKNVTWVGRVNYADRGFDRRGFQYEADVYPILDTNKYIYASVGYAPETEAFPEVRGAIEYFHVFRKGYESSLGFAYMGFSGNNVYLATLHGARSFGNYYIDIRPYFTYSDLNTWNLSGAFLFRRYFSNKFHHLTFRIDAGSFTENQNSALEAARLGGIRASLWLDFPVYENWYLSLAGGYGKESFIEGQYFDRAMAMAGIKYIFWR